MGLIRYFPTAFDDFFITSIGGDIHPILGYTPQFRYHSCQQEVKQDDEISFAFDAFNANSFLKLTGLPIVALNFPIILIVTDGRTGNPVTGATVNGATTDANGKVSVIFMQVGTQEVKATKPGALSNQIIYLTTKEKLVISNFR